MMRIVTRLVPLLAVIAGVALSDLRVAAHSGPPYPIVMDRKAGAYEISIWTDPDATDDGTRGGQFWIVLRAAGGVAVPAGTKARVAIEPRDRKGAAQVAEAVPVDGSVSRQFASLLMDHEGRFGVRVTIEGPLGSAEITSEVEATYDLRPPPMLLAVYVAPFVVLGALWAKLLLRRRRALNRRAS
jgi:hypothetical protein